MLSTTSDAVKSILKADPTITAVDRAQILALIRSNGSPPPPPPVSDGPRLIRRSEAAARLGRTLRSIDQLAAEGILIKRRFPGRVRSAGILESSLTAAIAG